MRELSTASSARLGHTLVGTACLLVAGCFGPHIESGSFLCAPEDDPPCPTGFFCHENHCVDGATGAGDAGTPADAAALLADAAALDDLTVPGGDLSAPPDLRTPPSDLATPRDLTPPPDLATGMCGHAGAPCTTIQDCCSMYCRTDNICIGG